jgi:hypothetical protein
MGRVRDEPAALGHVGKTATNGCQVQGPAGIRGRAQHKAAV